MPSKNPAQRLRDVVDNIDAIEVFTMGMDFALFAADRKTLYAVVRALEIVSEASRRLPLEKSRADTPKSIGWRSPQPVTSTGMNTMGWTRN
jgi:uncharacterized protein with HEPN domain